jgi:hypothetical protein
MKIEISEETHQRLMSHCFSAEQDPEDLVAEWIVAAIEKAQPGRPWLADIEAGRAGPEAEDCA